MIWRLRKYWALKQLQPKLTKLALSVAQDEGIKLDFSDDSIKDVDTILGIIRKNYLKSKSMDGIHGLAMEFGAYIATTISKNHGKGKLLLDHPEFGKKSFPFYWQGQTLFPYSWCLKRITDGKADDVWSKYQALVLLHDKS